MRAADADRDVFGGVAEGAGGHRHLLDAAVAEQDPVLPTVRDDPEGQCDQQQDEKTAPEAGGVQGGHLEHGQVSRATG